MTDNYSSLHGVNAYEILGLTQDAAPEDILAAHRRVIANLHPDRPGGVARLAQMVNDARDILLEQRAAYNTWLSAGDLNQVERDRPPTPPSGTDGNPPQSTQYADPWAKAPYSAPAPRPPHRPAETPRPDPWEATSYAEWESARNAYIAEVPPPGFETYSVYAGAEQAGSKNDQAAVEDDTAAQRRLARWNAPSSGGGLALLAALFCGPVGLWLGIRSCRSWHGVTPSAVLAITIGGVTAIVYLVALIQALVVAGTS